MTDEQIAARAASDFQRPQSVPASLNRDAAGQLARATFTRPFFLRVLAVAGITVGAALVVALIAAGLLLLGGSIDATGKSASGSSAGGTTSLSNVSVSGVPFLTALMVIVASMFFGSVGGSASVDSGSPLAVLGLSDANAHFSVFAPMLGLLLPVLFITSWLAWRLAPVARLAARLVEAAAAGLVVGIALEVLALLGTSSLTISGVRLEVSAVGFPLFAGGVLATFVASLAGTALAASSASRRRTLPWLIDTLRAVPARFSIWVSVPFTVAGIWALCFGFATFVGLIVTAILKGSATLGFASPILLGTAAVMAAAVGQLGTVVTETRLGAGHMTTGGGAVSVFTGAPWLWLAVVVALVATVLSAVALRRLRAARPIWLLPVLAVVAWALLPWVLATMQGGASLGTGAIDLSASATVHVAWWFGLVAGIWALATEALARWVLPAWTDRSAAGAARTRLLSLIVIAVLVIVATVFIVANSVFSASSAANAYLGQLQHGNTKAASAVTGTGSVLPLPAARSDRITAPEVLSVNQSGDTATASVRYRLAGKVVDADVRLKQQGSAALIFPRWVVAAPLISTISVTESLTDAVRVGGHALAVGNDGTAGVRVLPGVYAAVGQGDVAKYVAMSPARVVADGTGTEAVDQQPTAALSTAVQDAVRADNASCATTTEAADPNCPFATYVFGNYRNLSWSIDEQPTVEITPTGSWTATGGTATARYDLQSFFDSSYTPSADTVSLYPQYGTFSVTPNGVSVIHN